MVHDSLYGAEPPLGRVAVATQPYEAPPWVNEKVIAPVGAVPANAGVTVAVYVTAWVTTVLNDDETTLIEVAVGFTVWVNDVVEALVEKLASPL
jgi:hypothetical protein